MEVDYLRSRLQPAGRGFVLELHECRRLTYEPFDGAPLENLADIVAADLELLSAEMNDAALRVCGSRGTLYLQYQRLTMQLDTGEALTVAELGACARAYWEE